MEVKRKIVHSSRLRFMDYLLSLVEPLQRKRAEAQVCEVHKVAGFGALPNDFGSFVVLPQININQAQIVETSIALQRFARRSTVNAENYFLAFGNCARGAPVRVQKSAGGQQQQQVQSWQVPRNTQAGCAKSIRMTRPERR